MSKQTAHPELEHDEFIDFSHRLVLWASANRNALAVAAVVLVVLVGVITFARTSAAEAARDRADDFNAALESYAEALGATEPVERADKMAAAEKKFAAFEREHSGPLAHFAAYMRGNTWYFRGVTEENYRKAAEAFSQYALNAGGNPEARAAGWLAAGYSYESLAFLANDPKHIEQATRNYEMAARDGGKTWIAADALLGKARVLAGQKGREKEALPILAQLRKERSWKPPFDLLNDVEMTADERERLLKTLLILDEYGIARSAELLEARVQGSYLN